VRGRSVLGGLIVGSAALAGAILFVRTKSAAEREHVDVYFGDGSMISLPLGSTDGDRLLPLARRVLAAARG
jgi:hypothetical protein